MLASALALALALAALPDAPRAVRLAPALLGASAELPAPLAEARKLAAQLRYEEAVVEYQRYLALPERPRAERAGALFELGFIHLVLGDAANAEARALQALELDPELPEPAQAPRKEREFLSAMRARFLARPRLTGEPRRDGDAPNAVRVRVVDPRGLVKRVLLRHALAAQGPYYSTEMRCAQGGCEGAIPPPRDGTGFTAWYYVEALDAQQGTAARLGSPDGPLQLAVVEQRAWYQSPVTWGAAGAALVGVATVIYFLSPQPPGP